MNKFVEFSKLNDELNPKGYEYNELQTFQNQD